MASRVRPLKGFSCSICAIGFFSRDSHISARAPKVCSRPCLAEYRRRMNRRPAQDRFWEKVEVRGPDECWPFTGAPSGFGYGQFIVNGSREKPVKEFAHRYAWSLVHVSPPVGLLILHRCDNPPCCNVRHLFLGTQTDNMRDMVAKGRHAKQRKEAA